MSVFSPTEITYFTAQRLGRIATTNAAGELHVVPVAFRYNPELDTIDIGGHNIGKSRKFRDIGRDGRVAFVVDDVLPPWQPRGIEVRGRAVALSAGGTSINADFDQELIRITPTRVISWGIDTDAFHPNSRRVNRTNDPA